MANGIVANGNNIWVCNGNGSNAQKFKFEEYIEPEVEKPAKTIAEGTYVIRSAIDNNYALDVVGGSSVSGANVQLYRYMNKEQQRYNVKYIGEGYYEIEAAHSGKVIDVANAGKASGTNVWQCNRNGADAQRWIIKEAGGGFYYIISKCNGLYLDVANGIAFRGTNIWVCNGNNSNAQKFKFEEYKESETEEIIQAIDDGIYTIENAISSDYAVDVWRSSKKSGANIQLYKKLNGNRQRYKLVYAGDGYYNIIAVHSNMALDVANAGKASGTNVWQCNQNGSDAQKWMLEDAGEGYFYIISKCNGLYLDVANGIAANGTNIWVCNGNESNAQKFKFVESSIVEEKISHTEGVYGTTGLKEANQGGSDMKYYQYGNGKNVFFATFAIHGFEDLWYKDGEELVTIANNFYNELIETNDIELAEKWTIYIFPGVNLDGLSNGWTNNGPGRTTLYSYAPSNKGIDLNRCWQIGSSYTKYTDNRNYNGTTGFQAIEAINLRNFLLSHKSQNGQTVLVDLHGWTQQLIGDAGICGFYQSQFPENDGSAIGRYGTGYLINWARNYLGSNGVAARSSLIELPSYGDTLSGHQAVLNNNFSNRYITSTLNMLYSL